MLKTNQLRSVAPEVVLRQAGFSANEVYSVERANFIPNLKLRQKVFPWLEGAMTQLKTQGNTADFDNKMRLLKTLDKFRAIILQDMAILMHEIPDSVFAKQPLMKDCDFLLYSAKLQYCNKQELDKNTEVEPDCQTFTPVMVSKTQFNELLYKVQRLESVCLESLNLLKRSIANQVNPLNKSWCSNDAFHDDQFPSYHRNDRNYKRPALKQNVDENDDESISTLATKHSLSSQYSSNTSTDTIRKTIGVQNNVSKRSRKSDLCPTDKPMNPSCKTVAGLVNEWYLGDDQNPSVIEKERSGNQWRKSESTDKFYRRRKNLIQVIEKLQRDSLNFKGMSVNEIAQAYDSYLVANKFKLGTYCNKRVIYTEELDDAIWMAYKNRN